MNDLLDLHKPAPSFDLIQHARRKQTKQARVKKAFLLSALFVLCWAASMLAINKYQFFRNAAADNNYSYTMVVDVGLLLLFMTFAIGSFVFFINSIINLFDGDTPNLNYQEASAENIDELASLAFPEFANKYIKSIVEQGRAPTRLEFRILSDCSTQWANEQAKAAAMDKLNEALNK